jgi:NAD(P)H dehydrogenase (quinone)
MEKILVTGATGQLGTQVVQLISDKIDPGSISVLVRDPLKAESLKVKGITIHKGDYVDYSSLVKAFKGIDKLLFISTSDFTNREIQHENVIKAAAETKVKHIIYTSFQRKKDDENSPIAYIANVHILTEKLIKASGLTYTILKNGLYADFIPSLIGDKVKETGRIYLPAGNGKAAFTLRSDLAAGTAAILTGTGHENKTYEFSADKSFSFSEIASMLSEINGKPVEYISPSNEEFIDSLTKSGVPAGYISLFAGFAQVIKQGEFDLPDKTLTNTLGRKCQDLSIFLKDVYNKQTITNN